MAFTQATNFRVDNSHFVSATNAYVYEKPKTKYERDAATTDPLWRLLRRAAISATHESSSATYAPRCKQGTRLQVITDLVGWARSSPAAGDPRILWFSGPAGSGKTCIQREVASQLQKTPGKPSILAASYFFSNRTAEVGAADQFASSSASPGLSATDGAGLLDAVDPFIATIAYQLVMSIPGLAEHVEKAVKNDPMIFEKGLDIQASKLIAEPLASWKAAQSHPPSLANAQQTPITPKAPEPNTGKKKGGFKRWWARLRGGQRHPSDGEADSPQQLSEETIGFYSNTVVIDGWDEITNKTKRKQLLNIIRSLSLHETVPLRFIIASRPEHDIRSLFGSPQFRPITRHIKLEDYDGKHDVRKYICDEFERIRENHPASTSIPPGWPPEDVVEILVDKSSGQFIYPSVVIKFVDNPKRHPVELLKQVLDRDVGSQQQEGRPQPLAELYSLYDIILRPADVDRALMKRVLHAIHVLQNPLDCDDLNKLLSLPPGTTSIVLCDVHSLVNILGNADSTSVLTTNILSFHHKTTIDYLLDASASGDLYQATHETHSDLATCCIVQLQRWYAQPDSDMAAERDSNVIGYSYRIWDQHTASALSVTGELFLPQGLDSFDPCIQWVYSFLGSDVFGNICSDLIDQLPTLHATLCHGGKCADFCKRLRYAVDVQQKPHLDDILKRLSLVDRPSPMARLSSEAYKDLQRLMIVDEINYPIDWNL